VKVNLNNGLLAAYLCLDQEMISKFEPICETKRMNALNELMDTKTQNYGLQQEFRMYRKTTKAHSFWYECLAKMLELNLSNNQAFEYALKNFFNLVELLDSEIECQLTNLCSLAAKFGKMTWLDKLIKGLNLITLDSDHLLGHYVRLAIEALKSGELATVNF
jgi:tyrosine-protein phosphatase YwqE